MTMMKKTSGAKKPTKMAYGGKVKKMEEGKRTRRPAPVEEPVSKNVLIQAMEEDRRIAEANEKVQKKRGGGMCRGMGAATKGGNYKAS